MWFWGWFVLLGIAGAGMRRRSNFMQMEGLRPLSLQFLLGIGIFCFVICITVALGLISSGAGVGAAGFFAAGAAWLALLPAVELLRRSTSASRDSLQAQVQMQLDRQAEQSRQVSHVRRETADMRELPEIEPDAEDEMEEPSAAAELSVEMTRSSIEEQRDRMEAEQVLAGLLPENSAGPAAQDVATIMASIDDLKPAAESTQPARTASKLRKRRSASQAEAAGARAAASEAGGAAASSPVSGQPAGYSSSSGVHTAFAAVQAGSSHDQSAAPAVRPANPTSALSRPSGPISLGMSAANAASASDASGPVAPAAINVTASSVSPGTLQLQTGPGSAPLTGPAPGGRFSYSPSLIVSKLGSSSAPEKPLSPPAAPAKPESGAKQA
ncbi:hypothetical protein IT575_05925 [bacterium]|nr:hypothetical protein [bacterium]